MYKVLIHSKIHGEMWLQFNTQEEAQSFISEAELSEHYGKMGYIETVTTFQDDGTEIKEQILHEREVSFEIIDLTSEVEKENKLKSISDLEAKITPRRIREAVLSGDHSFIQDIESQIAAIRATL